MNILLINHYAGSEKLGMEYRPFYFAREWNKSGHHTTVVAASCSHVRSQNPQQNKKRIFLEEDGVEYLWIKTPKYKANSIMRFLNILVFVYRLCNSCRLILKKRKYDVVIASSTYPLDIFPARRIAKKSHAKLVFEVHDLWPLSPMELGGYKKYHPFIMMMQYAENFAYRKSDFVVSLLPKTIEHMTAHGLKEERWHYIPNGVNLDDWKNSENIPDNIADELIRIRKKYSRIVAYTGTYGLANALETFIDAARLCMDLPVAFVLFGNGPQKESLIAKVERESVKNVFIFGSVSKKFIPHLLSFFDFLFIGLQNQPLFRFGISPNKLMDYMMAGKPIIQAINAGNDMVSEAGCGLTVTPENPEAIAIAIRKFMNLDDQELIQLGENGKKYILENHSNEILAMKFIEILIKK